MRCPQCGFVNPSLQRFCGNCGGSLAASIPDAPERRHLTVLFCDLVGSTALSEKLDPEELSEIILAYREVVATAVERYGGYLARYIGDGILVYFGYPRAHDDDPVRAVHAALQILANIRGLATAPSATEGVETLVRIGVHTGLVVVGELARGTAREGDGILGETPNLAARLLDRASPGCVLVSGATHALIKNHFECRDMGSAMLKGLSRPITSYEVCSARQTERWVEFSDSMDSIAITDRHHEQSFLRQRWQDVLQGSGQAISITGDPGIGKSRLVRAFADSLVGSEHRKIVFYCSPYFSNSALFPVVDFLNRWLDKTGDDKLQQLADAVAKVGMSPATVVPIIASLLSLPLAAPFQSPQISSRIQRDVTMEFLLDWMTRQASERPTLLVAEDLHWADASSLELIHSLLPRVRKNKMLLLLMSRPDFHPPWPLPPHVARLPLDRLAAVHVQEMISNVTRGKRLPPSVQEQLVERTDGVPLFVEELTKAVIESDGLVESEDDYQLRAAGIDVDIPMSLQATLMARLDSLNSAKLVAQRAAVIGREFSYELLAAVTRLPDEKLEHGLKQLIDAELVFRRGSAMRATYFFKHSMIQEAAYQSLLRTRRQEYHREIAELLVARSSEGADMHPELIAHHYSAGRMALEAASHWRKAGEQALARSANVEAHAHIDKGLAELATCPSSALRIKEEVLLLISLGAALTAAKGYAAPEVEQTYARASELCRELDDPSHLFPVLRGLQSFYIVRGPLRVACDMVEQLRQMAEEAGNAIQRVEAHRRLGWCLFCMGKIEEGRVYLEKAIAEYDRAHSSQHIIMYGSDPAIIGLVNLAWLEWFAGHPESAKKYSDQSIALARELSFGLGLAYALGMSAAMNQCIGDFRTTTALAEETISVAEKHGFPYWVAWETSLIGWAGAMQGDVEAGIARVQKGLADYRATGAELFCPYILGLLAQISLRADQVDEALAFCEEALASAGRTDVHFFDSEILRLKGECLLKDDRDIPGARVCFQEALTVARHQGAKMLEIRAAIALASRHRADGEQESAGALLTEVLSGFEETQSFAELDTARRLQNS